MTSSARGNESAITIRSTDASANVFVFPTSFAQQRLWFLDQLVPGNAFYNVDSAIRMAMAPSDVGVLERSLNEVVRRHESLRTTFKAVDGQPVQVVCRELHIPLPVTDLRHLGAATRQAEALRLASEEAREPFDLESGPLLRTTLLRTGEAEYVFLLTMHHIVADGWSIGVFWKELTAIWQAFERGAASPLPPCRRDPGASLCRARRGPCLAIEILDDAYDMRWSWCVAWVWRTESS
jgi:Condensation domain